MGLLQNPEFYGLILLIGVVWLAESCERHWRLPRERWFRRADPPKALDSAYQDKVEQVTADAIKDRAKLREQEQDDLDTGKAEWVKRSAELVG